MLSPKSITTSAFCFCLLMTFCAVSAKADTMYTYTGPQFTEFGEANCPPECNITGSFTLATPLPANEVGAAITAKTPFAFSSGPFTGTAFGPFLISTNAAGAIDGWAIAVGEALDDGDIAVIFTGFYIYGCARASKRHPFDCWSRGLGRGFEEISLINFDRGRRCNACDAHAFNAGTRSIPTTESRFPTRMASPSPFTANAFAHGSMRRSKTN